VMVCGLVQAKDRLFKSLLCRRVRLTSLASLRLNWTWAAFFFRPAAWYFV
jgi:hypothetical protein